MLKQRLVAIVGKKGSGKDAIGKILCEKHKFSPVAFADKMKILTGDVFKLGAGQLYGTIAQKEAVDSRYGMSAREIMQKIGTEVGRQGKFDTFEPHVSAEMLRAAFKRHGIETGTDVWVESTRTTIKERRSRFADQVVTDCRFVNEARMIKQEGGCVVRVLRPGVATGHSESHPSETEQEQIVADLTIVNDGTLLDLEKSVDEMLFKLWEYV